MAMAHLFAGRFDAASSWAEKAFAAMPGFLLAVGIMAASHALADRTDEAQRAMQHLRDLDPTLRLANLADWVPCTDRTTSPPSRMACDAPGCRIDHLAGARAAMQG